jgi:anaerobic selenocysteine-containing dehydrogenase
LTNLIGHEVSEAMPWADYPDYLKHRLSGLMSSGQGSIFSGSFEESWVHFLEERGWRFLSHSDGEEFFKDMVLASGWWNPVGIRGDWERMFATPSGRFEFSSVRMAEKLQELNSGAGQTEADDESYMPQFEALEPRGEGELWLAPFRPITARSALALRTPMILEMFGYPVLSGWQTWVELNPETAGHNGVEDGDLVRIQSDRSSIEAFVQVSPAATPGVASVPLGLGRRALDGKEDTIGSNPMTLILEARDNLTGRPDLVSTRVRIDLLRRRRHGGPAPHDGGHAS